MSVAGPVLAIDFGSPVASVAVAAAGQVLAARDLSRERPPRGELLPLVDEVVRRSGVRPDELAGVVALAGPGSFTGVRIACATALALAQSVAIRAGALSTLEALALAAPSEPPEVVAVVDALRDEWYLQRFGARGDDHRRVAVEGPRLWRAGDAEIAAIGLVVGYGAERFATAAGLAAGAVEPRELAASVALAAADSRWQWRDDALTRPHYLRSPATTGARR